jgi:CDP-paratose 2-epimerase
LPKKITFAKIYFVVILITGGAGFIGSNLAIYIKKKFSGYSIYAFDNLKRRGSELNINRLKEAGVDFIHGDIRNPEDFDALPHVDVVIDASADPSVMAGINSSVYPLINTNLFGTVNCLELADKFKAAFIFLSTSRVYPIRALEDCRYGELDTRFVWSDVQNVPGVSSKGVTENFSLQGSRSFYGSSKLASELLIEEYNALKGIKTVINRCGVVSGPWQMGKIDQGVLVLWLARHYFKGSLSYIGYGGTGKQMRDVMHVDDLADLVCYQLANLDKVSGQVFNAGGGLDVSFSLVELTALCQEITGNKITVSSIEQNRAADIRIYVSDCTKLNRLTQWKPQRSLKKLLSDTYSWMKLNEHNLKNILN